jgi:CheY-like chemotaxis protein
VDEELAPYRQGETERIVVTGPAVFLQPASAQILALVLHELATNAVKYGAMSLPAGRVKVSWTLRESVLTLIWEETGGPPVQVPTSKGYGTKVINASVVQQVGGNVSFDWRPEGLRVVMSAPIGLVQPRKPEVPRRRKAPKDQAVATSESMSGGCLLLVEDEALVGMMMKDLLLELGYSVRGPFSSTTDAMHVASHERFQAAILDINVKGELIYELADAIAARDIPLVFVTGYGTEAVEERFKMVPVLQKPVDRSALERVLASRNVASVNSDFSRSGRALRLRTD